MTCFNGAWEISTWFNACSTHLRAISKKTSTKSNPAYKGASLTAVAQIAHRMKGASSNVAATSLARELASMEDHARNEQVPEAFACVGRLAQRMETFSRRGERLRRLSHELNA